jgi:coenzyme F420-reducing hydrogenase gamma subunit
MVRKIKIGIFKFTCCSGCQIEILNLGKKFLELTEELDFRYIKILRKGKIQNFDIAFIEGSASQKWEIEQLKEIRKKARYLIALGSCSALGGISKMQNYVDKKKNISSLPIEKYVKVDYKLRGCPIVGEEFLRIIKDLLAGKTLRDFEIPVCHECRVNNNSCLIERGKFCAGPITYFGCKAICPENNAPCIGCRGIIKDTNLKSWMKKMKENGFEKEAKDILKIFDHEP